MRNLTGQFGANLLGKSAPGADEVLALINLEEDPCALVDLTGDKVVFLNSRLVKISSFITADLRDKHCSYLFPNLDLKSVSSGEIKEVEMNRRGLTSILVKVRFDFIGVDGHWVLVRLITRTEESDDQDEMLRSLFGRLLELNKTSEKLEVEKGLPQIMGVICQILNVETAALYQADPSFPTLKRICLSGNATDLPDELPSTDLMKLVEPMMWNPGIRVITEIHRHARMHSVDYVATAPLKLDDSAIGILSVCGKGEVPVELRISILQYLSFQILNFIQKATLTQTLEERIEQFRLKLELQKAAVEHMAEAVILLRPDLTITEINPAAEWMLGYADREVQSQPYDNILIGTDRLIPALEDALKGNTTHNLGKANLNRRNGQSFPAQIKVIPVLRHDNLLGIEILIQDISENEQSKALTQQLEHRAVLGDYTAAFAHDLRNPINNISTGIQLMAMKLAAEDPNQEIINRIQGDCTRLSHLMESFMAFSRPMELKFESIDLGLYLARIVDRWRPKFSKVNVKPVINIEADIAPIKGDPRSLDQVFTNLISNALDAMVEKGDTLAIKASMNRETSGRPNVEISISDNGPGIPEDVKAHIFEPYVTTRQKGTGLGLAITKQIVTAHKGSISVNSFPGGTVFTVRLPADDGE